MVKNLVAMMETAELRPEWHYFGDSKFEVFMSELKTIDYNRISKLATRTISTRRGKVKEELDLGRLIEQSYGLSIHAFRGLTPKMLLETFRLNIARSDFSDEEYEAEISSDPIDDSGIRMMIALGKRSPLFHDFVQKHTIPDLEAAAAELELEKKT